MDDAKTRPTQPDWPGLFEVTAEPENPHRLDRIGEFAGLLLKHPACCGVFVIGICAWRGAPTFAYVATLVLALLGELRLYLTHHGPTKARGGASSTESRDLSEEQRAARPPPTAARS